MVHLIRDEVVFCYDLMESMENLVFHQNWLEQGLVEVSTCYYQAMMMVSLYLVAYTPDTESRRTVIDLKEEH